MPARHEIPYDKVGLVGFLEQVIIHLDRARIQAFTKSFPGETYAHGDEGIREYERERFQLRAEFDGEVEAICAELPEPVRRYGDSRASELEPRSWCPCGSGKPFKECHKEAVAEVRRKTQALGRGPEVVLHRSPRNPYRARRRR
jgi:hypothetical protein